MRQTINYTVTDDNRDKGKVFVLTEMSASQGEAWAIRALLAIMANNASIPEGFEQYGFAGLAEIGLRGLVGLKWEVAEPLLAEMMSCVTIMPDPSKPHVVRPLIESDIEEIQTRIKLRAEVWKLHINPSQLGGLLRSVGMPGSN